MINFLVGSAGSGKSIFIKELIIKNLQNNKKSIYLNFNKASLEFSEEMLEESIILNANSFSQISKLKEFKTDKNLIIINMTSKEGNLGNKAINNILKTIFSNENFEEYNFFIEDIYKVTFEEIIIKKLRKIRGDIFFSGQTIKDFKFQSLYCPFNGNEYKIIFIKNNKDIFINEIRLLFHENIFRNIKKDLSILDTKKDLIIFKNYGFELKNKKIYDISYEDMKKSKLTFNEYIENKILEML